MLYRRYFIFSVGAFYLNELVPIVSSFTTPISTRTYHRSVSSSLYSKKRLKDEESLWNTSLFPAKQFSPSRQDSFENDIPKLYVQILAALVGIVSGLLVAAFKLSTENVRQFCYGEDFAAFPSFLIPALGGIIVSLLIVTGDFAPGLRGVIKEVDNESIDLTSNSEKDIGWLRSLRKAVAAIFTLGTGNSLGPEGPGVEIGVFVSRAVMQLWPQDSFDKDPSKNTETDASKRLQRNRLLLSCGAAAGVSSGFNAPLSGVFFALEVVQASLPTRVISGSSNIEGNESSDENLNESYTIEQENLTLDQGSIAAILTSSVLSAYVSRIILGNELALELVTYSIRTPLLELPLYIVLGAFCGFVAVVFSQTAKLMKSFFAGKIGPEWIPETLDELPIQIQPVLGGITCGVVGTFFPQVLFFGYETLNTLLKNDDLPTDLIFELLFVKIFTTAVSAGSGLVGGTLAPSLFLGGMAGASFHSVVEFVLLHIPSEFDLLGTGFELADVPAYAMVGAASTLAALFRAPLTASLLLFELTRNYDVLLPLLVSAGVASLGSDILESNIETRKAASS